MAAGGHDRPAPHCYAASGWNLPETLRVAIVDPHGMELTIWDPQLANVVNVAVEPHATLEESEPNDSPAPQAVELPVTVSGRIDRPGDVRRFQLHGQKGAANRAASGKPITRLSARCSAGSHRRRGQVAGQN